MWSTKPPLLSFISTNSFATLCSFLLHNEQVVAISPPMTFYLIPNTT
ncbi:hypothetical protein D927_02893 [Enterococcus faecalis 02-MB-BW-10]|nr:hypothetical protein D927_02893 [Enterococcus faecalis 02-MB-BW-10]